MPYAAYSVQSQTTIHQRLEVIAIFISDNSQSKQYDYCVEELKQKKKYYSLN